VTDVQEAAAIVYAVTHGARIINLSVGGDQSSRIERRAIHYAATHGVLVVAAAGNEFLETNSPQYPAVLLQPLGSNGRGGIGLAVGATQLDGSRAHFSNTGSYISLAAPGFYGWASGTSFSAPEVAGAAALVWAANPWLTARQVANVLKRSASGGVWNEELGWGRLDVAAAVRLALVTRGSRPLRATLRTHARSTPLRLRRPPSSRAAPSP
jgi:subtilisin family serine protease